MLMIKVLSITVKRRHEIVEMAKNQEESNVEFSHEPIDCL